MGADFLKKEEEDMIGIFGNAYKEYMKITPMFIPKWRR